MIRDRSCSLIHDKQGSRFYLVGGESLGQVQGCLRQIRHMGRSDPPRLESLLSYGNDPSAVFWPVLSGQHRPRAPPVPVRCDGTSPASDAPHVDRGRIFAPGGLKSDLDFPSPDGGIDKSLTGHLAAGHRRRRSTRARGSRRGCAAPAGCP